MANPAAMYGGAPRLSDEMQRRALQDLLGAGVRGIGYTATSIPDSVTLLMRGLAEARPRFDRSPTEWRSDMPVSPVGDYVQGKITDAGYSDTPAAHIGGAALSMLMGAGLNKVAQAPMTAAERGMIRAYHGSPYDFDKFDASKIGTGEGAQAYGHGLYFAENPEVAKTYKWIDAKIDPDAATYNGKRIEDLYTEATKAQDRANRIGNKEAISRANAEAYFWESLMTRNHPEQVIDDALDPELGWPELNAFARSINKDKFTGIEKSPGKMYEVNIDADPGEFVDFDASFNKQPDAVKSLVRDELKRMGYLRPNDNGPRQLTSALAAWRMEHAGMSEKPLESILFGTGGIGGGTPKAVAERLNAAGIKGIKYLDQGSRSSGTGTRNYVVFDPETIQILRKYGLLAGAGLPSAYAAATNTDNGGI